MESLGLTDYCTELYRLLTQDLVISKPQGAMMPEGNAALIDLLHGLRERKGKVILVGNGGSAALVAHMHNDLVKCDGIRALLCTETSLLTAYTNDDGYETAYAQQVEMWGEAGDVLLAISSSGKSQNILNAVTAARGCDMFVVTMSGFEASNPLRQSGDINYYVPSSNYGYVEMAHGILGHYLTDSLALAKTQEAQVLA